MANVPSSHTWVKFFKDAGISNDLSVRYAVMFTDHRIKKDMLPDLDRDVLSDIGIKAVGDKMAIMKHAKFVAEQAKRDASSKQLADGINRSTKSRSPAERMIDSGISETPEKKTQKISLKPVKKPQEPPAKSAEVETKTVFDRLGGGSRSGVFSRLGEESKHETSVGVVKKPQIAAKGDVIVLQKTKPSSILSRLGAEVTNPTPDSSTSTTPLLRAKQPSKKVVTLKKKAVDPPTLLSHTISVKSNLAQNRGTTKSVLERLGARTSSVHGADEPVPKKMGKRVDEVKVVSLPKKQPNIVKLAPKRKLTGVLAKAAVPVKKPPISSNTVSSTSAGLFKGGSRPSVFDRLGSK